LETKNDCQNRLSLKFSRYENLRKVIKMKFEYDLEKKEYICPVCGARYSKYNSIFKHYQRKHSSNKDVKGNIKENKEGKLNVIAQSSEILRKDDKKDDFANDSDVKSIDKSMNFIDQQIDKSNEFEVDEPNKNKKYIKKKEKLNDKVSKINDRVKLYVTLFIVGVIILYILYKRGFFDPIINPFRSQEGNYQ